MAQNLQTENGNFFIPGAYPDYKVQNKPSGLATTGVIMLIGEADAGDHYSDEVALGKNAFGPDQGAAFVAKYRSGPLVDAYNACIAASNDPQIKGSVSRIIAVKTNSPGVAEGTIPTIGSGTYADVVAKLGGKAGNLISRSVTSKTSEVIPTTGSFLLCPPQQNTDVAFRVNGAAEVSATINAAVLPSAAVSTLNALSGVACTGGTARSIITSFSGNVTMVVDSGFQCHLNFTVALAATPTVGDILYIPAGSPLAAANEGSFVITAATSTRIDAYKLLDAAGSGAARTAPSNEGPTALAANTDVQAFAPVVLTIEAGAVLPGAGKTLEVAESGSENFNDIAFVFDAADASPPAAAADWVSVTATPTVITSSAEYQVYLNVARQSDAVSEQLSAGGEVVLSIGYKGTTAQAVITEAGIMTITVAGGSGTSPAAIDLDDYDTINDLVDYLNTLTGFSASAGTAALGQYASVDLDPGTYDIGSTMGAETGRIKMDGTKFSDFVNANSSLVNLEATDPSTRFTGLPDTSSTAFLTGGSKGATLAADVAGAFTALEAVRGNFVVTLFSRDADDDIDDGLTDASSTYTIEAVNAGLRSHVLLMSQVKRKRNRQGFASFQGTFDDAKNASGNMANGRIAMFFQDVRDVGSAGSVVQFQPWLAACKAAGMQSAGFYRPMVNKFINITGALQAEADFDDQNDTDLEDALKAGLCPITMDENGGYRWVSDQTTYTRDDNFVYNSIQAIYSADTVALGTAARMERAFVGQSVADISAALALTTLEGVMRDMKKLKLIAASDDAPLGFRNATIRITGPSMLVSLEIKLAGAIYFIPVSFLVTPVVQSAG